VRRKRSVPVLGLVRDFDELNRHKTKGGEESWVSETHKRAK
jgi:hypothetical protein